MNDFSERRTQIKGIWTHWLIPKYEGLHQGLVYTQYGLVFAEIDSKENVTKLDFVWSGAAYTRSWTRRLTKPKVTELARLFAEDVIEKKGKIYANFNA